MKHQLSDFPSNSAPPPTLSKVLQLVTSEFVPPGLPSLNDTLLMLEEAWWYYIDVYRLLYPELPRLEFMDFVKQTSNCVPSFDSLQNKLNTIPTDKIISDFNIFKSTIPCYGAIIMDEELGHILAVQAFRTTRWGFPKGKMKIKEDPIVCAVREVDEEIGLDVGKYLVNEPVEIVMGKKKVTYFFCPFVPITTPFQPKTRMEIHKIAWLEIEMVKKEVVSKNPDFGFFNQTLLHSILSFVAKKKGIEPDLPIIDTPKPSSQNNSQNENSFGLSYFLKLYSTAFQTGSLHR